MTTLEAIEQNNILMVDCAPEQILNYLRTRLNEIFSVVAIVAPTQRRAIELLDLLKELPGTQPVLDDRKTYVEFQNGAQAYAMQAGSLMLRGRAFSVVYIENAANIRQDQLKETMDCTLVQIQASQNSKLIINRGDTFIDQHCNVYQIPKFL